MKNKLPLFLAWLLVSIFLTAGSSANAQSATRRPVSAFGTNIRAMAMALPPPRSAILSRPYLPEVSTSSVDIDICHMPFTRSNGGWANQDPNWSGSPQSIPQALDQSQYPACDQVADPTYSTCDPSAGCSSYSSCGASSGCGISISFSSTSAGCGISMSVRLFCRLWQLNRLRCWCLLNCFALRQFLLNIMPMVAGRTLTPACEL